MAVSEQRKLIVDIKTGLDIGDVVLIDGQEAPKATVLSIFINAHAVTYRVGWFFAGALHEAVIDEFRLSLAEKPKEEAQDTASDYPKMGGSG